MTSANQTYLDYDPIGRRKPSVVGHWRGSTIFHAMTNGRTYCGQDSPGGDWIWMSKFVAPIQVNCRKCLKHRWFEEHRG